MASGVYIATHDPLELMDNLAGWFGDREDVHLIGRSTVSKTGASGFLVRFGGQVDRLFLTILQRDNTIEEYSAFELQEPGETPVDNDAFEDDEEDD